MLFFNLLLTYMNAVNFRRQEQRNNALKKVENIMSHHKPAVMNGTGPRHFNHHKNDVLSDDKKILTVDEVIYSSFEKKKNPKDKKSILFKSNGEQRDKEGDLIPNRKNKKALKKYLKDEIKRINMLDE